MTKSYSFRSVRLDPDLDDQLHQILRRERRSFNRWVIEHAELYVRAHKAGNPAVPLDKFIADPHYVACPTLLEAHRFHWRGLDTETLQDWRAVTFRLLKQIQDEEGRRKAGGTPE